MEKLTTQTFHNKDLPGYLYLRAYRNQKGTRMKPGDKLHEQSRPKRASLAMQATLICANAETYSGVIQDLSSKGFRIESSAPLIVGDHVDLQVGVERVSAQIRWVSGSEAGGEFDRPVLFPS